MCRMREWSWRRSFNLVEVELRINFHNAFEADDKGLLALTALAQTFSQVGVFSKLPFMASCCTIKERSLSNDNFYEARASREPKPPFCYWPLSCVTPKLLHLWLVDIWNLRNVFRLLTKRQRTYASTTTPKNSFPIPIFQCGYIIINEWAKWMRHPFRFALF